MSTITETGTKTKEETLTDVRLARSYRTLTELIEYLERTHRSARAEERGTIADLLDDASRMHGRLSVLIGARGKTEAE